MSNLPSPITVPFATFDGLDLKADLYVPPRANGALPGIIYFHGGGLTTGSRRDIIFPLWLLELSMARGVMLISADYRFLLPVSAKDEIEDVKALFRFLSGDLSAHLPSGISLDANRLAVTGFSAGAYIGRLACLYAEPRPRAFASFYGMGGDWLLDFWLTANKTKPMSEQNPLLKREELAHIIDAEKPEVFADLPLNFDESFSLLDRVGRGKLWRWWWQNGDFLDHLTGKQGISEQLRSIPHEEREGAIPSDVADVFTQLHIRSDFPPTILLHGSEDTLILLSETLHTYEQLKKAGVRSELHVVSGAEHGLILANTAEIAMAPETETLFPKTFEFLMAEIA